MTHWNPGMKRACKNQYRYLDDHTIEIQLTRGKTGYIDVQDIDLLKTYTWSVDNTGRTQTKDHTRKTLRMHRLIIEKIRGTLLPSDEIVHLNGNRTDNRRCNLYVTDRSGINMRQRISSANTSGIKGVYYDRRHSMYQGRFKYKGTELRKSFSIDKYGREGAKALALEWRNVQMGRFGINI